MHDDRLMIPYRLMITSDSSVDLKNKRNYTHSTYMYPRIKSKNSKNVNIFEVQLLLVTRDHFVRRKFTDTLHTRLPAVIFLYYSYIVSRTSRVLSGLSIHRCNVPTVPTYVTFGYTNVIREKGFTICCIRFLLSASKLFILRTHFTYSQHRRVVR